MDRAFKWGFTDWNKVPIFYSKTNKKYYWEKCKPHLSSNHSIELLGDISQIKEYFNLTEQMLNSIRIFAVENHLDSELDMVITESNAFLSDLQLLHVELNNLIERQENFKLKELEDKAYTLKSSIEQNQLYFEYLYLKEIFSIRHREDTKSAFLAAVEVKAEGIAEKKWLKLKEEFVKVLDAAEQDYKCKTEAIILEANAKFDSMKFELEQKLSAHINKYKFDTEKLQKDIETLIKDKILEVDKLNQENNSLKSELVMSKFNLNSKAKETVLI